MPFRARVSVGLSGNRGQALAEFALLVPVLAFILLAIIQVGFVFAAQMGITNSVREAARLGAVTSPTSTAAEATSNGQGVYDALTDTTNGFLKRNVFAYAAANLVTSGSPDTQVCYQSFTDSSGKAAITVDVEASYRHPLFIPIVGAVLDGLDGTNDGALRVGASEQMRVENEELPASFGGLALTCYNP